jgi:quercetin dioxygenase-like cupin family protein
MRLRGFVVLLVALAMVPITMIGAQMQAGAQDATPSPGEAVKTRTLASGSLQVLTPGTAILNLGRITSAPGASVPFDPQDPSAVLIYVSSGALTFQVAAPMTVARLATEGTPSPTGTESVEANTPFTLNNGDSALFPPAIAGEVRNEGQDEASAWLVNVAVQAAGAGTPAAGTPAP